MLPEECTFDYIYEKRDESNIGEIINEALEAIEEENKAFVAGGDTAPNPAAGVTFSSPRSLFSGVRLFKLLFLFSGVDAIRKSFRSNGLTGCL